MTPALRVNARRPSYTTSFLGNQAERFQSNCSAAPAERLSRPCPRHSGSTLGSWRPPRCCTCWARPDAAAQYRPVPGCTVACRGGTHPPPAEMKKEKSSLVTDHPPAKLSFESFKRRRRILLRMTACWLRPPGASCQGWTESPPKSEGRPGGWPPRRSPALPGGVNIRKTIQDKTKKCEVCVCVCDCSGHCGEAASPWWHVPETQGWTGSPEWSHSLDCSGKDWRAPGPVQTICHTQTPQYWTVVRTHRVLHQSFTTSTCQVFMRKYFYTDYRLRYNKVKSTASSSYILLNCKCSHLDNFHLASWLPGKKCCPIIFF